MLELYVALRKMLYPATSSNSVGQAKMPTELENTLIAPALLDFERSNRGHHRLLGDLRMARKRLEGCTLDAETESRRATLARTTQALVNAVLEDHLIGAQATYTNPLVDAVMHASDPQGWIGEYTSLRLSQLESFANKLAAEKMSAFNILVYLDTHLSGYALENITQPCLHLTFRINREKWATRVVLLPYGHCASLRDARHLYDHARQEIESLIASVGHWPEFADKVDTQRRHDKIRQDLADMTIGYSPEDLEYLNTNWRTLLPKTTARRWQSRYHFESLPEEPGMVRTVKVSVSDTQSEFMDTVAPMVFSATAKGKPVLEQLLMGFTCNAAWLRRESKGMSEVKASYFLTRPGTVSLAAASNYHRLPSQWFTLFIDDFQDKAVDAELQEISIANREFAETLFNLIADEQIIFSWATS